MSKIPIVRKKIVRPESENVDVNDYCGDNTEIVEKDVEIEENVLEEVEEAEEAEEVEEAEEAEEAEAIKEDISLDELTAGLKSVDAKQRNVQNAISTSGVFGIINCKKAKRITISNEAYTKIGEPSRVCVATNSNKKVVLVGEKLPIETNSFTVKNGGNGKNRVTIYSSELTTELTRFFELDFSDKTSITVGTYSIIDFEDVKILVIKK